MPTQIPVKGHTLTGLYFASLAQSVEHAAVNRRVVGSSPTGGANCTRTEMTVLRRFRSFILPGHYPLVIVWSLEFALRNDQEIIVHLP